MKYRIANGGRSSGSIVEHRGTCRWTVLVVAVVSAGCGGSESGVEPAAKTPSYAVPIGEPTTSTSGPEAASPAPATVKSQQPEASVPQPAGDGAAVAQADVVKQPPDEQVEQRFRNPDRRPEHNDQRLLRFGIQRFESKRLRLYSDLDPKIAETLPSLVDRLYDELVSYFGEPLPDRDGREFQLTGYVMADRQKFSELGLLPAALPDFPHGRHSGYRFWMNDQKQDYYRRHLLLHEAVHCFMTAASSPDDLPPVWYMEGMAELFATHHLMDDSIRFAVMPHNKQEFAGLGRITQLSQQNSEGRSPSIDDLCAIDATNFMEVRHYAAAWAFCYLLANHPAHAERFRAFSRHTDAAGFETDFEAFLHEEQPDLESEWTWYLSAIQDGFDVERNAIRFRAGEQLPDKSKQVVEVVADSGWQSAGIEFDAGAEYRLSGDGRVVLAETTKPWSSAADGITFQYFDNSPIGQLQATIYTPGDSRSFVDTLVIGSETTIRPNRTGTLYLRINDSPAERADNSGRFQVTIVRVE